MVVVAQDKPRSEEQGEGGDEDTGEMRRQRKSLRVRGSQERGDGERWEQSLGQEQRRRQPWSDAERYKETLWHGPSQREKRWTEPREGEEESPVRETEREGKEAAAGRTAEMQTCGGIIWLSDPAQSHPGATEEKGEHLQPQSLPEAEVTAEAGAERLRRVWAEGQGRCRCANPHGPA